jgi:hypothetical protein
MKTGGKQIGRDDDRVKERDSGRQEEWGQGRLKEGKGRGMETGVEEEIKVRLRVQINGVNLVQRVFKREEEEVEEDG